MYLETLTGSYMHYSFLFESQNYTWNLNIQRFCIYNQWCNTQVFRDVNWVIYAIVFGLILRIIPGTEIYRNSVYITMV